MDKTDFDLPIKEKIKVINGVKIDPKYLPFRCPVCNGFGTLRHGTKTCQACRGKGYILVPNKDRQDGGKNENKDNSY